MGLSVVPCPYCGKQNAVKDTTPGHRYTCFACGREFVMLAQERPGCLKAGCSLFFCGMLVVVGLVVLCALVSVHFDPDIRAEKHRREAEKEKRIKEGGALRTEFCPICRVHFEQWTPCDNNGNFLFPTEPCPLCLEWIYAADYEGISHQEWRRRMWDIAPHIMRMPAEDLMRLHDERCKLCK